MFILIAAIFIVAHKAYQQDRYDYDGSSQADQDELSRFQAIIFIYFLCNRVRYGRNFDACYWRCHNNSAVCNTLLIDRYRADRANGCVRVPGLEPNEFLISAECPPCDFHVGFVYLVLSAERYRVNAIDIEDQTAHPRWRVSRRDGIKMLTRRKQDWAEAVTKLGPDRVQLKFFVCSVIY